jgi:hypothetical protein
VAIHHKGGRCVSFSSDSPRSQPLDDWRCGAKRVVYLGSRLLSPSVNRALCLSHQQHGCVHQASSWRLPEHREPMRPFSALVGWIFTHGNPGWPHFSAPLDRAPSAFTSSDYRAPRLGNPPQVPAPRLLSLGYQNKEISQILSSIAAESSLLRRLFLHVPGAIKFALIYPEFDFNCFFATTCFLLTERVQI